MNFSKPLFGAVALASLALTACVGAPVEGDEQVESVQQDALTVNALTVNALTVNALTVNALTVNALTVNALTVNALTVNALTVNALQDPNAREVLKYIVSCALPADVHFTLDIDGVDYPYSGQLGLAPEWGLPHGHCDGDCQQWVSACVISRLDFLGVQEEISVRGDNPGLKTSSSERSAYTNREATYYGDIFSSPQRLYGCLSPGKTEDPRVCGPTIQGCGVDVLGSCQDLCGHPGADGSFPDCRVPNHNDGGGCQHQGHDDVYEGSITVFLHP